jgi:hypothetical protein
MIVRFVFGGNKDAEFLSSHVTRSERASTSGD